MAPNWLSASVFLLAILAGPACAQDLGTLNSKPLPPLANPNDPRSEERRVG
ncbi:MAG: penicillin-insensitive murein endopeptidase, partial [Xanthobacteraceae bacterium]|nr:penicillin-insensitive murein endopeptidase [Xanthobacteraceae bacterium]